MPLSVYIKVHLASQNRSVFIEHLYTLCLIYLLENILSVGKVDFYITDTVDEISRASRMYICKLHMFILHSRTQSRARNLKRRGEDNSCSVLKFQPTTYNPKQELIIYSHTDKI